MRQVVRAASASAPASRSSGQEIPCTSAFEHNFDVSIGPSQCVVIGGKVENVAHLKSRGEKGRCDEGKIKTLDVGYRSQWIEHVGVAKLSVPRSSLPPIRAKTSSDSLLDWETLPRVHCF
jgi:hypothetical protein